MLEKNDLYRLNVRIKNKWGLSEGKAKFRVSWTTGELEKRYGTFNEFHGPIFLRTITGLREVVKYPYNQDRFVLERVQFQTPSELVCDNHSYEPVWYFEDKDGQYLPYDWEVIEIIIESCLGRHKETMYQHADRLGEKFEKQVEMYSEVLANEAPLLSHGGGVTVPRNYGEWK